MTRVLTRLERARRRLERAAAKLAAAQPENYSSTHRFLQAQSHLTNTLRRRLREYRAVEAGRTAADWMEFSLER